MKILIGCFLIVLMIIDILIFTNHQGIAQGLSGLLFFLILLNISYYIYDLRRKN